jgi:hypothetical protein
MKTRTIAKIMLLGISIAIGGVSACAGDLTFTINQPFKAAGKNYPAGDYRVLADEESDHINLTSHDKKIDDEIKFATRLSPRVGKWGEVVFDKVDSELFLTEVYIVGMDGYFFQGAPGKHKHLSIRENLK